MSRRVTRMFGAVTAGFALIASGLATACAASAARPGLSGSTAQSTVTCCSLSGVADTSAGNAWAVGRGPGRTAILHWNGTAWTRVPSPGRAYSSVAGVTVVSTGDAWAVGDTSSRAGRDAPLILHWNGTIWKQVPSPNLSAGTVLYGVAASSADDAWAVGTTGMGPLTCGGCTGLILHWNGTTWKRVPSPSSPSGGILVGVAAASAHSAWAVGATDSGNTLILHWTGTAWEQERSPNPTPGHGEELIGVAATSAKNAWAVGYAGGGGQALIVHWNGVSWSTMT